LTITKTNIEGCVVIEPTIFEDDRGVFFESYNERALEHYMGEPIDFVQDNHSISRKGVLRGLHFQHGSSAQTKLVRVIRGEVMDVVVDIRKQSRSFGEYFKIRLSEENKKMLFIPQGLAHGFLALEDNTQFVYKCDQYYKKEAEGGIIYNDPDLKIDWEFPSERIILSEKDKNLSLFKDLPG
jgi:dTDP-4-dehydrorhamnose 3,5-epimerase